MKHDSTLPDPTIKPPNTMSTPAVFLLTLLGSGFVALLIWIGAPLFTSPPSLTQTLPPSSPINTQTQVMAAPATYPPEILQAAQALATTFAPTPTATPAPPRPTPTPIRELWCPDDPYVLPTGPGSIAFAIRDTDSHLPRLHHPRATRGDLSGAVWQGGSAHAGCHAAPCDVSGRALGEYG
jgi:hypothetical protein